MAEFALVCEGVTDQVTITNILCGFFDNEDLDEDVAPLQPPYDATTQKQRDFGGWQMLLEYLKTAQFRDAVLNNRHVIVHIDSDVSPNPGFDVPHADGENQELSVETVVDNIIAKLIANINTNSAGFYEHYQEKIIFCISVHSIECWLLAHYASTIPQKPKTKGCEKSLKYVLEKDHGIKGKLFVKNYAFYNRLSEPLLDGKRLRSLSQHEPSLRLFLASLEKIDGL
ncbi:MAG: phage tail protein [Cyanobacteria bacterium P01_F01_bin.150]